MNWKDEARCKGQLDKFFPDERTEIQTIKKARLICTGCPVKKKCLSEAIRLDEVGIWGGMTTKQRDKYKKENGLVSEPKGARR